MIKFTVPGDREYGGIEIDLTEMVDDMLMAWTAFERMRWEDDGGLIPPEWVV